MKTTSLAIAALLIASCNILFAQKTEEEAIKKLLEKESYAQAKENKAEWASCWLNTEEVSFLFTSAQGVNSFNGFKALSAAMGRIEPFDLKLKRGNYRFDISGNLAFVRFDTQDNYHGGAERTKKETRTLRKLNGAWKIIHSTVINVSSFEPSPTASYHMPANQIPKNPRNGFTNLSGFGGMSIGYMEVPGPADFTPFFKGLPDDMCSSPHWGYVIEGSLKIIYPGGKEDIVNAGEVFYWPAPHTGVVEKNVKFIDISPDGPFKTVMDHLAKKMKEMSGK